MMCGACSTAAACAPNHCVMMAYHSHSFRSARLDANVEGIRHQSPVLEIQFPECASVNRKALPIAACIVPHVQHVQFQQALCMQGGSGHRHCSNLMHDTAQLTQQRSDAATIETGHAERGHCDAGHRAMRALAADPAVITGRRGESCNAVAQRGPPSECTRQGRCVAKPPAKPSMHKRPSILVSVDHALPRARPSMLSLPALLSTELPCW